MISKFTRIFFIVILLSVLVSCSTKPKDPTEPFWGQWEYYDTQNGYDAFRYDIEFVSDGTFLIPDTPYLMVNTFEYGLLDGNRLRLTAMGQSEIVEYDLEGDMLKLIFEDGYNLYRRKGSSEFEKEGVHENEGKEQVNTSKESPEDLTNKKKSKDVMEMVFIPKGEFQMGCDPNHNGKYNCRSNELPLHTVNLRGYAIDKTEVTNAQYAQCVQADQCKTPKETSISRIEYYYGNPEFDNFPVVNVSWYDAQEYCSWIGKRLPTEAEWEKAARGTTPIAYPWGDADPTCDFVDFINLDKGIMCGKPISEVGSFQDGASPYGLLDMAGNVSEWVSDFYSDSYYEESPDSYPTGPLEGTTVVIRGGFGSQNPLYLRTSLRNGVIPNNYYETLGFRCAASGR